MRPAAGRRRRNAQRMIRSGENSHPNVSIATALENSRCLSDTLLRRNELIVGSKKYQDGNTDGSPRFGVVVVSRFPVPCPNPVIVARNREIGQPRRTRVRLHVSPKLFAGRSFASDIDELRIHSLRFSQIRTGVTLLQSGIYSKKVLLVLRANRAVRSADPTNVRIIKRNGRRDFCALAVTVNADSCAIDVRALRKCVHGCARVLQLGPASTQCANRPSMRRLRVYHN